MLKLKIPLAPHEDVASWPIRHCCELDYVPPRPCLIQVIGGSKSGKSKLMEVWAQELATTQKVPLIYLATMEAASDLENIKRIERHQRQRAGRGFQTLEQPRNLRAILEKIPPGSVVLMECLGTWLANEIFGGEEFPALAAKELAARYFADLLALQARCSQVILACNDVFSEALAMGSGSLLWQQVNAIILRHITAYPQSLSIEVSAGIPLALKLVGERSPYEDL